MRFCKPTPQVEEHADQSDQDDGPSMTPGRGKEEVVYYTEYPDGRTLLKMVERLFRVYAV